MPANPYGYQTNPNQTGYFQQDTPVGSFAGAAQQWAQNAAPVQQQYGQAYNAANPYIGQTTQGISGQQSVMPWAQAGMSIANQANPYLGQATQQSASAGANPYAGSNPYLQQAIDSASADATRNFNLSVRPALDSAARASGSFGNSAIQELQQNAYSDLGRNLGNIASGMRMQDYGQQQQLAEAALNRQQQNNQFNSGLSAADLSRNMQGYLSGQGIGLQGAGLGLQGAQFDATLGNNVNQFNAGLSQADLARNAGLQQSLGQFNAGQQTGMSQFNAGQGNSLGQYNAGLQQSGNQFNAGQGNALNQFNAGSANTMLGQARNLMQNQQQFDANLANNRYQYDNSLWNNKYQFDQTQNQQNNQFNQNLANNRYQFDQNLGNNRYQFDQNLGWNQNMFNQNMDFNTWQANNANMRAGNQDTMQWLNTLMGLNTQGVNAATNVQNTPLNYWSQFLGGAAQAGGLGGSTSTNMQGNPYLGMLGGWQLGNQFRTP